MAAEKAYIEPITRISSHVWFALGIEDFPSVYNKISPNPVAAIPSLHAGFATLFSIWVFRLFRWKWGLISLVYPLAIYFGTVYQGEHYAIDEILGALYAVVAFVIVFAVVKKWPAIKLKYLSGEKNLPAN
jgi:membrane-associated phospholipid phosphatase